MAADQQLLQNGGGPGTNTAFYQNVFGIQAPKKDNNRSQLELPEYLQKAAATGGKRSYNEMNEQNASGVNYQPPFKVGGSNAQRKDTNQIN